MEDVIVKRLTADRIDELKKLIKETQETHRYAHINFKGWKRQCVCFVSCTGDIVWTFC